MPADPYYANVSLIVPMEGANNTTTFADLSAAPKNITRYGDAKISTAQAKWSLGSGYFDGNTDRLEIAHASLQSGTGAFTAEMLAYIVAHKDYTCLLNTQSGNNNTDGYYWGINGAGKLIIYTSGFAYTGALTVPTGSWVHLAMVRSGNTVYFFVGGQKETGTWSTSAAFTGSPAKIGGISWSAVQSLNGHLQDVRYTLGVARYTANYTPPGRLTLLYQLVTLSGNATVISGGGAAQVVIRDVPVRTLIATATPDVTTGDWTASVPPGDYDISYFAPGCQPICHGPYTAAPT